MLADASAGRLDIGLGCMRDRGVRRMLSLCVGIRMLPLAGAGRLANDDTEAGDASESSSGNLRSAISGCAGGAGHGLYWLRRQPLRSGQAGQQTRVKARVALPRRMTIDDSIKKFAGAARACPIRLAFILAIEAGLWRASLLQTLQLTHDQFAARV